MEPCTVHLEGMLDRDQRTAKMCIFDRHVVRGREPRSSPVRLLTGRNKTISHRPAVPGRTSPCRCRTRKNDRFWKSLHRLKHALIVGAYLSLVTFPSILSAPTLRMSLPSGEPKWQNPCGMGNVNGGSPSSSDHRMSDESIVSNIINAANIAQKKANQFTEAYVQNTFSTTFQQHHNFYKEKDYDWLPTKNIPKQLGEPVPEDHLESLELQPALISVYGYLQQIAVGLEQMAHDEVLRGGPYKNEFKTTEDYLRSLLCEIQTAIIEKEIPMPENVTRDIMGKEFRHMDNTSMNIRNWIIFRDYLNMLEYIMEVFEYFKTKLPTIG